MGPANSIADYLLHTLDTESLHTVLNTAVCPVLTDWLPVVVPHLDVDNCVLCVMITLGASKLP